MLQIQKRNQNWMPSVFDDLFMNGLDMEARPSMNVIENGKEYQVKFAAPGFSKEEVSVTLEDGCLAVSLQSREDRENSENGEKYLRREFVVRNYRQSFELPADVDTEKISASLECGILNVVLPKYGAGKGNVTKRIEIC